MSMRGGWMKAVKKPIDALAKHLGRLAGDLPCVDETGLQGLYDFEVDVIDRETLVEELAKLGLRYRKEQRVMPVYVFQPAES